MPRVIAIDYGLKRTGLAVTDPLRIIASALDTVPSEAVIDALRNYLAKEAVDGFVVGLPMGLDGGPTDATPHVQGFIKRLRAVFPDHWVETADERFTSRMAQHTMAGSGRGRMARRDKGAIDRISATIILQSWLERKGS